MDREVERQFDINKDEHNRLQTNDEKLMADIKQIKDDINDIKLLIAKLPEEFFEKADEKYPSKSVEKGLWWIAGVLFSGLVGVILFLFQEFLSK